VGHCSAGAYACGQPAQVANSSGGRHQVGAGVSGNEEGTVQPGAGATLVGLVAISFPARRLK
jgi:hypothetical protein